MTARPLPPPYGTVVFDCDSTLCAIEGIEELSGAARAEIRAMTDRAMAGEIALEDVFRLRLEIVRPGAAELEALGRRYVETLMPGARELAGALRALGKRVCIVSGGLLQPVLAVARALGIDERDVRAVRARIDAGGAFAGFDEASPLARSGGKLEVVRELARGERALPPIALVGDGATDLEAAPACARFVAYGGVARRAPVFAGADATSEHPDHAALLPLLCDGEERARLSADPMFRAFVERARELRPNP